jgi:3-oxoacyl-[acyl-carrier-protein] synthase II
MSVAGLITGTGMVSSVGDSTRGCFTALCNGVTGNRPLASFDPSRFNLKRAYEIADRPHGRRDCKGRATRWLCAAVTEALNMAGLDPRKGHVPAIVGSGLRELRGLELWLADDQPLEAAELHFGHALRELGVRGQVTSLSNACAASIFALGLADDLLALGEADAVIVAGCDSITETMFGLADRASILHPERVQPFDRDRRGTLLGEGAAALVLESADSAVARGAFPLAVLRGVGMSCDAYHETTPDREGMLRAMRDAHLRAGVSPGEIDLLLAHGTGTELNDRLEAAAIRELFGEGAGRVVISALKSMLGHTSGASGLIAAVTAVECLNRGLVPPTVGLAAPMPEAERLDIVVGEARVAELRVAQVNAFGFGGVNAVAVLEAAVR